MKLLLTLAFLASAFAANARDLYVDPVAGDERANGLAAKPDGTNAPVKRIAHGLKLAQPGDTVHLAPVVFKESAVFFNRQGEPGKPITLDGHGATLDGGEPLDGETWHRTHHEAPVFRNDQLLPRLDDAILGRWFFHWGGKMNHMGRTSKGPSARFKDPGDLQPGEWTFVKDDSRKLPDSQQVFGAFFIRLPQGQKVADANIIAPVRSAGVQFSGDNRHLVIRNLTATHVYNDGYNIHGHCEDVLFQNIRAIECGDDGISAHETAQYRVENFVSIGNSTGICDTGSGATTYDGVFIKDCLGHDLFFLDSGRYSVSNALVISSASRALVVTGRDQQERPCSLELNNVWIRRVGNPTDVRVTKNSVLTARNVTFENLSFQATGGEVSLERCAIFGTPTPEMLIWKDVQWRGANNFYNLKSLRFDKTSFTPQTFADFQKLTGQEANSQWSDGAPPAGIGADTQKLRMADFPVSTVPSVVNP
jgi:hypothetical protein